MSQMGQGFYFFIKNPLTDEALASSPGFARNIERYAEYEKLRVSKYFSEEALKRLRTREEEFTLLKEEES